MHTEPKPDLPVTEAEGQYRGLLETASDAITIMQDRRYVSFNRAWVDLLGYTPDEIRAHDIVDFVDPASRAMVEGRYEQRLRGDPLPTRYEVKLRKKDGTPIDVELHVSVIVYQGKPAVQAIIRDMTEYKLLQEQLIRTERLQAVGQMATGVAHDFNNLLAIILGRAQLLSQHLEDQQAVKRGLQIIEKAAVDGAEVVRRIQHFTGLRWQKPFAIVDVNAIVRDAVAITRPRWQEEVQARGITVQLTTSLTPGGLVEGEAIELREVLVNLIFNALDAMPQGGIIRLNTATTARHALLTIADTGGGMTPAAQRRAFEPFFTTKGPQSSGLGLSISYGIMQRHGGVIAVDSHIGRGTTVTITLPRVQRRGDGSMGQHREGNEAMR